MEMKFVKFLGGTGYGVFDNDGVLEVWQSDSKGTHRYKNTSWVFVREFNDTDNFNVGDRVRVTYSEFVDWNPWVGYDGIVVAIYNEDEIAVEIDGDEIIFSPKELMLIKSA